MATATLARAHRPARRPATDELVAVGDVAAIRRAGIAHVGRVAGDGVRDSRRILSEALAAAQAHTQDDAFVLRCYVAAALDPRMDAEQLHAEALAILLLGGVGYMSQDTAREAAVAYLEGWEHHQHLAGRSA